jgi:hypothetical protein
VGKFGAQVVPRGVQNALAYAVTNKIPNVVFTVDSQGGDRFAARDIYKILAKYADKLRYIALVRDSVGVSVVVTLWCKDVFMLPGASLGGVMLEVAPDTPTETAAQLSQVAYEVGQDAEKRGWPAPLVRAMVDPAERVFAWRGEDGKVATAPRPPSMLPAGSTVVNDSTEGVLTLSREEAVGLGLVKAFDGSAADLGGELGLSLWTAESDQGGKTMVEAARKEAEKAKQTASRKEADAARLIKRRDALKSYIDRNITMAHSFDPEQNVAATTQEYTASWERYWDGAPVQQNIGRTKWRELTDYTIGALSAAYKGATEMEKLEADAKKLGLEPLYKEGELEKMKEDMDMKVRMLQFWRERKTSS